MLVCANCLRAIESREGNQPVLDVTFDPEEQKCEWCGEEIEEGFDILPE